MTRPRILASLLLLLLVKGHRLVDMFPNNWAAIQVAASQVAASQVAESQVAARKVA